jgi:hypothetical protein
MAQIIAPCGADPTEIADTDCITEFTHPFEHVLVRDIQANAENGSRFDIRASAYHQKETYKNFDEMPDPMGPVVELHVHNLDDNGDIDNEVIELDDMSESECEALILALQVALNQARVDAAARGWKP